MRAISRKQFTQLVWTGALLLTFVSSSAQDEYQSPADFIADVFAGSNPVPQSLWITKHLRSEVARTTGVQINMLRMRYWQQDTRTIWILDEIGKEQPITTGVVVNAGKVERVKVLVFRESRGWEVRYPFFTDQFFGAELNEQNRLDRDIDNISGATLSVNALKRQSQVALLLDAHLRKSGETLP
jgi:hypothetical protein